MWVNITKLVPLALSGIIKAISKYFVCSDQDIVDTSILIKNNHKNPDYYIIIVL